MWPAQILTSPSKILCKLLDLVKYAFITSCKHLLLSISLTYSDRGKSMAEHICSECKSPQESRSLWLLISICFCFDGFELLSTNNSLLLCYRFSLTIFCDCEKFHYGKRFPIPESALISTNLFITNPSIFSGCAPNKLAKQSCQYVQLSERLSPTHSAGATSDFVNVSPLSRLHGMFERHASIASVHFF